MVTSLKPLDLVVFVLKWSSSISSNAMNVASQVYFCFPHTINGLWPEWPFTCHFFFRSTREWNGKGHLQSSVVTLNFIFIDIIIIVLNVEHEMANIVFANAFHFPYTHTNGHSRFSSWLGCCWWWWWCWWSTSSSSFCWPMIVSVNDLATNSGLSTNGDLYHHHHLLLLLLLHTCSMADFLPRLFFLALSRVILYHFYTLSCTNIDWSVLHGWRKFMIIEHTNTKASNNCKALDVSVIDWTFGGRSKAESARTQSLVRGHRPMSVRVHMKSGVGQPPLYIFHSFQQKKLKIALSCFDWLLVVGYFHSFIHSFIGVKFGRRRVMATQVHCLHRPVTELIGGHASESRRRRKDVKTT